ncbi:MAG: ammonia-forming cytochrome c nitrite reductase subunit c552, partial [Desulfovibrio sp.]|nr:ammonia-forming cytochrome c nitrite reductase subunit c552 [Desulfovibrio sp.]
IRKGQWRWDYAVASHGASFHAPAEYQRIISHAIEFGLKAQLELQKVLLAHNATFEMPDVSTKAKAQAYIGLDMPKLEKDKKEFLNTIVPKWEEQAKKAGIL